MIDTVIVADEEDAAAQGSLLGTRMYQHLMTAFYKRLEEDRLQRGERRCFTDAATTTPEVVYQLGVADVYMYYTIAGSHVYTKPYSIPLKSADMNIEKVLLTTLSTDKFTRNRFAFCLVAQCTIQNDRSGSILLTQCRTPNIKLFVNREFDIDHFSKVFVDHFLPTYAVSITSSSTTTTTTTSTTTVDHHSASECWLQQSVFKNSLIRRELDRHLDWESKRNLTIALDDEFENCFSPNNFARLHSKMESFVLTKSLELLDVIMHSLREKVPSVVSAAKSLTHVWIDSDPIFEQLTKSKLLWASLTRAFSVAPRYSICTLDQKSVYNCVLDEQGDYEVVQTEEVDDYFAIHAKALTDGFSYILQFCNGLALPLTCFVNVPATKIFENLKIHDLISNDWTPMLDDRVARQDVQFRSLFANNERNEDLILECQEYHNISVFINELNAKQRRITFWKYSNLENRYGNVVGSTRYNVYFLIFPDDWELFENSTGNLKVYRYSMGQCNVRPRFQWLERDDDYEKNSFRLTLDENDYNTVRLRIKDPQILNIVNSMDLTQNNDYRLSNLLYNNHLSDIEFDYNTFEYKMNCYGWQQIQVFESISE